MYHALINMLEMQDRMNSRVHADWRNQNFEWYRAIWIECGELIEHYGYKWWKKQQADLEQVRLEVIDIWHFGLSALFRDGLTVEQIADDIVTAVSGREPAAVIDVRAATEALALHALQTRGFSPSAFWDLMHAVGLDFDTLYTSYVGKNVLNFFRQDHGYQEGTYMKHWAGREDNEHLLDLMAPLDCRSPDFADRVYEALAGRYRELAAGD